MKYSASQFIKAIPGSGGIIQVIASRVGCDWHTANRYVNEYATVREAYLAERETVLDIAEAQVIKAIKEGDISTIRWYLSTIGKNRGYVERQERSGPDGGPIVLTWPEA